MKTQSLNAQPFTVHVSNHIDNIDGPLADNWWMVEAEPNKNTHKYLLEVGFIEETDLAGPYQDLEWSLNNYLGDRYPGGEKHQVYPLPGVSFPEPGTIQTKIVQAGIDCLLVTNEENFGLITCFWGPSNHDIHNNRVVELVHSYLLCGCVPPKELLQEAYSCTKELLKKLEEPQFKALFFEALAKATHHAQSEAKRIEVLEKNLCSRFETLELHEVDALGRIVYQWPANAEEPEWVAIVESQDDPQLRKMRFYYSLVLYTNQDRSVMAQGYTKASESPLDESIHELGDDALMSLAEDIVMRRKDEWRFQGKQ